MSVTWKCFDGTQRTDISDVRNEFRFQANKAFVSVTVWFKKFVHYLRGKNHQWNILAYL